MLSVHITAQVQGDDDLANCALEICLGLCFN